MIVDEKQRYNKAAKILCNAFIVMLALLSALVMIVGLLGLTDAINTNPLILADDYKDFIDELEDGDVYFDLVLDERGGIIDHDDHVYDYDTREELYCDGGDYVCGGSHCYVDGEIDFRASIYSDGSVYYYTYHSGINGGRYGSEVGYAMRADGTICNISYYVGELVIEGREFNGEIICDYYRTVRNSFLRYYCSPLVLLLVSISLLALLLQIMGNYKGKSGRIAGVVNIIVLLPSLVFAILHAVEEEHEVCVLAVILLGAYIILSGAYTIRGRYIAEKYPKVNITLISFLFAFPCAAVCMSSNEWQYFWFWIAAPCLTAFVIGAGIAAYVLGRVWWCDSCNRKNKGKAKFCCGCGKPCPVPELPIMPKREKRVKPAVATAVPAPQQTAPAAQAPQQTAPVQTAEQQEDWFCGECGTKNEGVSIFCENCGAKNPFKQ